MQSDQKGMFPSQEGTCLSHLHLTQEQAQAACAPAQDALILAGPGSGKTHTLRARVLHLLDQGQNPQHLFITSFSAQSAQSMKNLIQSDITLAHNARADITSQAVVPSWIGTFHALAGRLLRPISQEYGLSPHFRILDTRDQKRLMAEKRLYWTEDETELTEWIEKLKADLISPEQLEELIPHTQDSDLARQYRKLLPLYHTYQSCLQAANAVDFSDLLRLSVTYLESGADHPYKESFDHLIIDEYQDINLAQFRLLKALHRDTSCIWAVGDDDQAIYGWRGSDPKWIRDFQIHFPKSQIYRLQTSFRCPPVIAQSAESLISHNHRRHGKSLSSATPHQGAVQLITAETAEVEANYIVHAVTQALSKGLRPHDIAILIRSSMGAFDIMRQLDFSPLDYRLVGAAPFWQHPAAKLVTGAMALALNPEDRSAHNMVGAGKRGKIIQEHCHNWQTKTPEQIIGYTIKLTERYWPRKGEKAQIWSEIMQSCHKIASACETIALFLAQAEQHRYQRQSHQGKGQITLTTIHAAKGLEWPMVILAGCEEGMMPHILSKDDEEERRLFFVAITRTRNWLICTRAEQRNDRKNILPSPYLSEMSEITQAKQQRKTVFLSPKGELITQQEKIN